MQAAVLRAYGEPLEVTTVPDPTADPDGAVVDVDACGLCRSDWHAWQGHGEWADDQVPLDHVLGHEPAGTIRAVGAEVERFSPGDRVVVPFSLGDGTCHACRSGQGNVCENGTALGFEADAPGAFAEQVAVPAAEYNLVELPSELTPRDAAALGCRYMTAFHALADRADLEGGESVVVYGCGGVGLSAVQLAIAIGARVFAVDPKAAARDRAQALGADVTIDPDTEDPVRLVRAATDGGVDVAMDALGIAETCTNAVRSLRPRGRHLQVGLTTTAERGAVSLPTDWMTRWEITFLGARGMPPTRYEALFDLLRTSDIDPGALVSRELSLEEVSDRLAAMSDYEPTGVEVITSF